MPKKPEDTLGGELAKIKKRLHDVEAKPRLGNSSLDNVSMNIKDDGERVKGVVGKQIDGSHGSRVVESPAQPTPDAPVLSVGKTGVVAVRWGGGADGPVPLVHGHVEVQAMGPSDADWQVVGTIRDRSGGATTFAADESGTSQVRLVLVGQDRVTRSEASGVSTVEVELPASTSEVQAAIESADGKNVLTYDPDGPQADGQGVGDVHFQIDDVTGVVQQAWRWDGTAWVEQSFGDEVLDSISAGKITAGTIEAAVGIGSSGYIRSTDDQGRTSEMVGGGFFSQDSAGQVVFDTRGGQLVARGASVADGMITGSEYRTSSDWYGNGGVFINGPNGQIIINDSDGNTAASLGAQGNSLSGVEVQGSFQTAYPNGAGVTIDRGDIEYYSAETGSREAVTGTPYMRITPRDGESPDDPTIATDGQRMIFVGGQNADGDNLPIVMDGTVEVTRLRSSYGLSGSTLALTDAASGDRVSLNKTGLRLTESTSSQPTGFARDSSRTQILGRQPWSQNYAEAYIHSEVNGDYTIDNPGGSAWYTFSVIPPPTGGLTYQATLSVDAGNWGLQNQRTGTIAVGNESASGFDVIVRSLSDENDGGLRFSINWQRTWR